MKKTFVFAVDCGTGWITQEVEDFTEKEARFSLWENYLTDGMSVVREKNFHQKLLSLHLHNVSSNI